MLNDFDSMVYGSNSEEKIIDIKADEASQRLLTLLRVERPEVSIQDDYFDGIDEDKFIDILYRDVIELVEDLPDNNNGIGSPRPDDNGLDEPIMDDHGSLLDTIREFFSDMDFETLKEFFNNSGNVIINGIKSGITNIDELVDNLIDYIKNLDLSDIKRVIANSISSVGMGFIALGTFITLGLWPAFIAGIVLFSNDILNMLRIFTQTIVDLFQRNKTFTLDLKDDRAGKALADKINKNYSKIRTGISSIEGNLKNFETLRSLTIIRYFFLTNVLTIMKEFEKRIDLLYMAGVFERTINFSGISITPTPDGIKNNLDSLDTIKKFIQRIIEYDNGMYFSKNRIILTNLPKDDLNNLTYKNIFPTLLSVIEDLIDDPKLEKIRTIKLIEVFNEIIINKLIPITSELRNVLYNDSIGLLNNILAIAIYLYEADSNIVNFEFSNWINGLKSLEDRLLTIASIQDLEYLLFEFNENYVYRIVEELNSIPDILNRFDYELQQLSPWFSSGKGSGIIKDLFLDTSETITGVKSTIQILEDYADYILENELDKMVKLTNYNDVILKDSFEKVQELQRFLTTRVDLSDIAVLLYAYTANPYPEAKGNIKNYIINYLFELGLLDGRLSEDHLNIVKKEKILLDENGILLDLNSIDTLDPALAFIFNNDIIESIKIDISVERLNDIKKVVSAQTTEISKLEIDEQTRHLFNIIDRVLLLNVINKKNLIQLNFDVRTYVNNEKFYSLKTMLILNRLTLLLNKYNMESKRDLIDDHNIKELLIESIDILILKLESLEFDDLFEII